METYKTFPQSNPVPDANLASARVDGQAEMLDAIRAPLVVDVLNRIDTQEAQLRNVYKPLINAAKAAVSRQQTDLDEVSDALQAALNSRVGQQAGMLASVMGSLPPDERVSALGPTLPPGTTPSTDPNFPNPPYWNVPGEPHPIMLPSGPTPSGFTTFTYEPPKVPPLYPREPVPPEPVPPVPPVPPGPVPPVPPRPPGPTPVPVPPSVPGRTPTVITSTRTGDGCPAPVVNVTVNCPTDEPPTEPTEPTDGPRPRVAGWAARRPVAPLAWDTADKGVCKTVDAYVTEFARVGAEVREFMAKMLGGTADLLSVGQAIPNLPPFGTLIKPVKPVMEIFERVLRAMEKMIVDFGGAFGGPRADTLVGLYFVRGFLNSLNAARLGFNFILTAEISIDLVPVQTLKIVDYLIQYLHPVDVPALGTIDALYLADKIGIEEAVCLSAMNGRARKETIRQIDIGRQRLTPDLEVKYWLTRRAPRGVLEKTLREYGMTDFSEVSKLVELNKLLPPPSDAVRFSNRDVFDPNKLGLAEMRAEYAQQVGLQDLFNAVGLEKKTITTADGRNVELDLPFWYYIAAYEEASPTQGYEFLHRFRPNRVHRYPLPKAGGGVEFPEVTTIETIKALLKEKDYNPLWRKRLAAASFRLPGRIDIRNMYRRGVFGEPRGTKGMDRTRPSDPRPLGVAETELAERYQDLGMTPIDGNALTLLDTIEFDRLDGGPKRKKAMSRVCAAYKVGGFTQQQAEQQLTNVGLPLNDARDFIQGCDLDMRISDLKLAVGGVKKQWLAGVINEQQARDLLRQYGVVQPRVETLLSTWRLYRTNEHRELTAQQIGQFWEEGLINLADARARLLNLNFDLAAANMILNHVRIGALAKSEKEQARRLKAEQADRERRARLLVSEEEKRMRRFLVLQSEKNLIAWWKAGNINREDVRAALVAKGSNPTDISRWLATNDPQGRE